MTSTRKRQPSINDLVPLSFDIPNGWTREAWNGCLLLGHPEGGFGTVDFEAGLYVLGLEDPKDAPKRSVKVLRDSDDWQERLVQKVMAAMEEMAA